MPQVLVEPMDFPIPQCVLVIMAHPDDPEFSAGGTIARWSSAGTKVIYLIVTDGSKGSDNPELDRSQLTDIRRREQRAAAAILGVTQVEFLDYADGEVYPTRELRRDLVYGIRRFKPDLLLTHDPTVRIVDDTRINHPDHIAVGEAALAAAFPLARDRLNYPEHDAKGLDPHIVMQIMLTGSLQPNLWVDVSDTIDTKINAVREHHSQIGDFDSLANRIRERAQQYAQDRAMRFAERFRLIKLNR